ncbi:hypothetical protein TrVE_jg2367 [Triparma verrucosa]|uniref:Spermatogenesis-associated protein 4 n=1 Tax=Triparma verrucosa TaxID=1606542 RepID=A0A9W7BC92_9STRA|nr:hypothetical protein TrVE_jg2367 [Triparma verrucosa]
MATTGNPNSLSREVLRWIQSLDLAYSIKNPKRDFSNGFLIAEIFSRYFARGLAMHSYDNGTAVRVKKDNWGQLMKFFRKQGLDIITDAEITSIIHCEDGAVATFIKRIYQALTQREVQEVVKRPLVERPPPYMRNTGSKIVKDTLRTGNFTEHPDQTTTENALRSELEQHEADLQLEKSIDPERFSSSLSLSGSRAPHVSKAMGEYEAPVPQVTVERIEVKQSDKNIAALRASQDPMAAPFANKSIMSAQSNNEYDNGGSPGSFSHGSRGGGGGGAGAGSAKEMLDDVVKGWNFSSFGEFAASLVSFEDAAVDCAEGVFDLICAESERIASGVLNSADFGAISGGLCSMLRDLPESSNEFKGAAQAFCSLGLALSSDGGPGGLDKFADHALATVSEVVKTDPAKRPLALEVFYSFVPPAPELRVDAINKLKESLGSDDISALVHCLTNLIFIEDPSSFDPLEAGTLLDLYLEYVVAGLGQSSPSIRSASLAMLSEVIANCGASAAQQFIEPLQKLSTEDTFWETKAQLLVVATTILQRGEKKAAEMVDAVVGIVESVFHGKASGNVKKVGVAYLSSVLGEVPQLMGVYLDVLLSMKSSDRAMLMGLGSGLNSTGGRVGGTAELPVGGKSGLTYSIQAFDGNVVARGLLDRVSAGEAFGEGAAQVLLGCVLSQEDVSSNSWTEVWDGFVGLVLGGLKDGELCDICCDVAFAFVAGNNDAAAAVYENGYVSDAVAAVYGEGGADEAAKEGILMFLTRVANNSGKGCDFVEKLLGESSVVSGDDDLLNLQADLAM